jgi:hypothetical protein
VEGKRAAAHRNKTGRRRKRRCVIVIRTYP